MPDAIVIVEALGSAFFHQKLIPLANSELPVRSQRHQSGGDPVSPCREVGFHGLLMGVLNRRVEFANGIVLFGGQSPARKT